MNVVKKTVMRPLKMQIQVTDQESCDTVGPDLLTEERCTPLPYPPLHHPPVMPHKKISSLGVSKQIMQKLDFKTYAENVEKYKIYLDSQG